ncbi:unnamed protein product [Clonostachys rosea f. rosea IK726]|uniref:Uncharacterized protein n=3 Tax=Bionectria ochroleuca TaxID=29856 RepID=A0A8H7NDI1_BIOOC|nr:unnamed protein product [Clonostachys rosea f. rosea IK726]
MRGDVSLAVATALSLFTPPTTLAAPITAPLSIPFHLSSRGSPDLPVTLSIGDQRKIVWPDAAESVQLCDPDRVTISGQALAVEADGLGRGLLKLEDESIVSANWTLNCVEEDGISVEQTLKLEFESVNGEPVKETTGFVASFGFWDGVSQKKNRPIISTDTTDKCHSWNCFFHGITDCLKNNLASCLKENLPSWYPDGSSTGRPSSSTTDEAVKVDDKKLSITNHPSSTAKEKPIKPSTTQLRPSSVHPSPSATDFTTLVSALPPPDKSLVLSLVMAAFAFGLFSLFSIGLIHRRIAPQIRRRPRHRETPEERRARVESRKARVGAFFSRLFCGLFRFEEKDDRQLEEGHVAPQGRDLRRSESPSSDDESITMEQELARFREAANMVSSLIAFEEGRSAASQPRREDYPPAPPARPTPAPVPADVPSPVPRISTDDPSLPTYENDTVEGSMVADGFRYVPGSDSYPAPTSGVGSPLNSNSDRLGYGNKD